MSMTKPGGQTCGVCYNRVQCRASQSSLRPCTDRQHDSHAFWYSKGEEKLPPVPPRAMCNCAMCNVRCATILRRDYLLCTVFVHDLLTEVGLTCVGSQETAAEFIRYVPLTGRALNCAAGGGSITSLQVLKQFRCAHPSAPIHHTPQQYSYSCLSILFSPVFVWLLPDS